MSEPMDEHPSHDLFLEEIRIIEQELCSLKEREDALINRRAHLMKIVGRRDHKTCRDAI